MNNIDLYKQFYFKELATKTELNNAVTLPMTIITAIVTAHIYLFSHITGTSLFIISFFSAGNFLAILSSLAFLIKSYMNNGKTYRYAELPGMDTFYDFQKKCEEKKQDDHFVNHLEQQFSKTAGENFKVNVIRTQNLAYAKVGIFMSLLFTSASSITYILSLIIK